MEDNSEFDNTGRVDQIYYDDDENEEHVNQEEGGAQQEDSEMSKLERVTWDIDGTSAAEEIDLTSEVNKKKSIIPPEQQSTAADAAAANKTHPARTSSARLQVKSPEIPFEQQYHRPEPWFIKLLHNNCKMNLMNLKCQKWAFLRRFMDVVTGISAHEMRHPYELGLLHITQVLSEESMFVQLGLESVPSCAYMTEDYSHLIVNLIPGDEYMPCIFWRDERGYITRYRVCHDNPDAVHTGIKRVLRMTVEKNQKLSDEEAAQELAREEAMQREFEKQREKEALLKQKRDSSPETRKSKTLLSETKKKKLKS